MAVEVSIEASPVGLVVRPPGRTGAVMLFLDGGNAMSDMTKRLAVRTGTTVVCPRYRPTFPDAITDVATAYRHAEDLGPVVMVGGARMGAGLAAALLVHRRDSGDELPTCAVLVSGLLDLSLEAMSLRINASNDPTFDLARHQRFVASYAGGRPLTDPLLSPLYANLDGLPPVQLHVASTDPLLDDSLGFAARVARSRIQVDLRVWPDSTVLHTESVAAVADFTRRPHPVARTVSG